MTGAKNSNQKSAGAINRPKGQLNAGNGNRGLGVPQRIAGNGQIIEHVHHHIHHLQETPKNPSKNNFDLTLNFCVERN